VHLTDWIITAEAVFNFSSGIARRGNQEETPLELNVRVERASPESINDDFTSDLSNELRRNHSSRGRTTFYIRPI
jgi:hypothetical protein